MSALMTVRLLLAAGDSKGRDGLALRVAYLMEFGS
jgi:hypothetical protein